jgi:hypothetical protein
MLSQKLRLLAQRIDNSANDREPPLTPFALLHLAELLRQYSELANQLEESVVHSRFRIVPGGRKSTPDSAA